MQSLSASADAEPEESLPTLTRDELEGIDKETVMVMLLYLSTINFQLWKKKFLVNASPCDTM